MAKVLGLIALLVIVLLVMSWCVQILWAASLVPVLSVKALSYGQAMALFVLCNILFKGSSVLKNVKS